MSTQELIVKGSKGGGDDPYIPKESPDNLQSISSAKILLALGEGEFEGVPTARDIYLDDTPLADSSGNLNFPGVRWEYRSGSVDQDYIKGMPSTENEFGLNYRLEASLPYVRAVNNTQLSAVRIKFRWPQLTEQKSNGDLVGSAVEYAIDISTDGGAYVTVLQESVVGKTTGGYERSRRVNLPEATSGWQVRVRRITSDSGSASVQNTTFVTGFTEIIDAKLRYPNTALLFVEFDASQFQNIPKISVRIKGRGWPVPTNYDPITRTYTGTWDGTFKNAWTDNPVWIGYGIMIHKRFGLGKRINASNIDKWELYRISQYCDDLVSDGKGGLEPRFTCNLYIQNRAEAWTVLRDIAAIYRGMVYWSNSLMSTIADMPRDVDYIFSRSNVVDGKFVYSGSSERNVYTRALVSYDNPDNLYNSDVVAVSDLSLQRRYGDNLLELTAIGCTSESEAQRRGKWALYTNSKNRSVTFQVGLDGNIPLPGYIVGIADPLLAGRPTGGRISAVNSIRNITLDRESQAQVGDTLIINLPSGKAQSRTINSVTENGKRIGVTADFTEMPEVQAQWSIDAQDLAIQLYRVTKITKDEPHLITITGVFYDPNKYDFVDNGARREDRPITVIPPSVQAPPTNVTLTTNTGVEQTMAFTTLTIKWDAPLNAVYYTVEWRKDDKDWVTIPRTGATSVDIPGVFSGQYLARVRAYNSIDVASLPASSVLTNVVGKEGNPPAVVNFSALSIIFGIELSWNFPVDALDTNYTEIEYSPTTNFEGDGALLGTFAYPLDNHTLMGLRAGQTLFFRARLVDKTGNIGPWTATLTGMASDQANDILEYLVDQISETELAEGLLGRIDLIDGDGPGSVNQRLDDAVADIDAEIAEIRATSEYTPTLTYVTGDIVRLDKRLYQALQAVPVDTPPPNVTYWKDVGTITQDVNALAVTVSQNSSDISEIDGELTALATETSLITSQVDDNTAAISAETTARTTADNALSTQITTVSAVASAKNRTYRQTAAPTNVPIGTLVTGDLWYNTNDSNKLSRWSGSGWVATEDARIATNTAAIQTEATARADADSALATQITTVQATANSKNKTYRQTAAPTDVPAGTLFVGDLWYDSDDSNKLYRWSGSAWVATDDARISQNTAAIQTETTARANGDSALASQITTVQTTANNASSTAQTALTTANNTNGDLSAMWSVKLQMNTNGQYVMAGVGLGIENVAGSLQSNFIVRADQFSILNNQPDGTITSPFIVSGGQTFIDSAIIKEGTISSAMIGEFIQSTNYVPNTTGWRLDKAGTFEINGVAANQGRLKITNQVIEVYDNQVPPKLRVRMGIWT